MISAQSWLNSSELAVHAHFDLLMKMMLMERHKGHIGSHGLQLFSPNAAKPNI